MSFSPDSTAVQNKRSRRFNQLTGWQTVDTWRGPQAQIEAKEAEYIANGWDVNVSEGAVWEMEATISAQSSGGSSGGTTTEPVDEWELDENKIEKDLLNTTIEAVYFLDNEDLSMLRAIIEGNMSKEELYAASTNPNLFHFPESGDPWLIFYLHLAGVKSLQDTQPILRHTKTAARTYEIPASQDGVASIWTTDALRRAENIPALVSLSLPESKETSRTIQTSEIPMIWGWWKHGPKIQYTRQKVQIVQEWDYGLWPTELYTGR